jgi:hypothetical protein
LCDEKIAHNPVIFQNVALLFCLAQSPGSVVFLQADKLVIK